LKDMPIDGLVHISAIPGDYWVLDQGGLGLIGRDTKRRWQLGQALRVRLNRVDLAQRQIDFTVVEPAGSVTRSRPSGRFEGRGPRRRRG
jgi:ribonuclease R